MIIRFSSHPRAKVRHKGPLGSASASPGIMYSNTSCYLTWDSLRKQLTFCDSTAERMSEEQIQKFLTDNVSLPRFG